MIRVFQIENFKSHANTALELSNINLLTGINGIGKSSIIQTLLLLRQSHQRGLLGEGLELIGALCSIGTVQDCIYQYANSDTISFSLDTDNGYDTWNFEIGLKQDSTFIRRKNKAFGTSRENDHILFGRDFQYISAFRNGPTSNYIKDTASVELFHQISRKEGRCELVAHFLDHFRYNDVDDSILVKNEDASFLEPSLITQTEAWMQAISPGINLHISPSAGTSFKITYSYDREGAVKTNEFTAPNIGFGVSYVLPIIAATLQACSTDGILDQTIKNKLIIIENPEAHIHPSGQAKLMELISKAARLGVQFIIETHSDHIVNGLLLAVKNEIIAANNAKVYFFDRDAKQHATQTYPIEISANGRIKKPPKGFFDQMDIDLEKLMGF